MKLLRILAVLAIVTIPVAQPVAAQDKAAPRDAAAGKLDAENLLIGVPEGFVVGDRAEDKGQLVGAEFIPKDETLDDWSRMITVQVFRGAKAGPDDFARNLQSGWEGACPNSTVARLGNGRVNGYRYVAWSFDCPLNPRTSKPETMWLKVLRGNDALYAVQYSFRALATDAFSKEANSYLAGVSACDTRTQKHPCPALK